MLAFIGRLPGMFGLSLIGAGVAQSKANLATLIVGVLIFISFIIYLYRNKLENKMIKLINKLKHNK